MSKKISETLFSKFIKENDYNIPSTPQLRSILAFKDKLLDDYNTNKTDIINQREDISMQIEIVQEENNAEVETYNTRLSDISTTYNSSINFLEEEVSRRKQEAQSILKEYDMIISKNQLEHDCQVEKIKQALVFIKTSMDNFQILPSNIPIDVTDKDLEYHTDGLLELAKKSFEEINLIEDSSNQKDYFKKNTSFGGKSKFLSTSLKTIVGVSNLIKDSLNLAKDFKDIDRLTENIVFSYRVLQRKLELLGEYSPPPREPYETKYNEVLKSIDEYYKTSKAEIERTQLNDKLSLQGSKPNNLDISDYQKDVDVCNEKLKHLENEYQNGLQTLQQMIDEFNASQTPILLNPLYQELIDKRKQLQKMLATHNDYESISLFSFTTELPSNVKLDRYWFKLIEKERKYKAQLEELKEKLTTIPTKEEVEQQLIEIDESIKSLYRVTTANTLVGIKPSDIQFDNKIHFTLKPLANLDLKNKPLLIVYRTKQERVSLCNYLKYIVYNLMGQYHPKSIVTYVLDKNQSYDFSDLQISLDTIDKKSQKLKRGDDYVVLHSSEASIKSYTEYTLNYISNLLRNDLHSMNFSDLVEDRFNKGALIPKMRINIIVDEDLSNPLLKYNEDGFELGVINILFTHIDNIIKPKEDKGEILYESTYEIRKTLSTFGTVLEYKDDTTFLFTDIETLKYTDFQYTQLTKQELGKLKEQLRGRAINTPAVSKDLKSFVETVVGTPTDYFKGDIDEDIKLYLGYVEGDVSNPKPVVLDETSAPHMAIFGTTGGGKSNLLSVIYNTVKATYSPEDIDVRYFDFKIVEVALHVEPYKSPNASILSGSCEPEYIKSATKALYDDMMIRYTTMKNLGFNKLSDYRRSQRKRKQVVQEKIDALLQERAELGVFNLSQRSTEINNELNELKQQYDNTEIPPRVLIIIDEITQGFKSPDPSVKEALDLYLTKILELGRANGFHLVTLTQDPSNMPDKMLALMPHRGCTVAPVGDISKLAIGNDFCKLPENQFLGFFGVNSLGGDVSGNVRYVVPYAPAEYTPILTKTILEKCKKENIKIREAITFSESDLYPLDKFEDFLDANKPTLDGKTFFVGEGAYHKTDSNPHMFKLARDDRQSIAIISNNIETRLDVLRKLLLNLEKSDSPINIFPVFSKDIYPEFNDIEKYEMIIYGKELVNPREALKLFNEASLTQMFKNDLFNPSFSSAFTNQKDIDAFSNANTYDFFSSLEDLTADNKKERMETGKIEKTTYFIVFDFDKHSEVMNGGASIFKELARLSDEANNNNIYIIHVASNFSKLYTYYCAGYWITSEFTPDADTDKLFKLQPSEGLSKLVDLQGKYSAVFKLPMYEPPYQL